MNGRRANSQPENDEDLSRMAILLDSPQGRRQPVDIARGASPMTRGLPSFPVSRSSSSGDGIRSREEFPLAGIVDHQPMPSDNVHTRSVSDTVSSSAASHPKRTDWFWDWHTSPPQAVSASVACPGSTDNASTEQASVDLQRQRSHSSPATNARGISSARSISVTPKSLSPTPVPSQPMRLFSDGHGARIIQTHLPQPGSSHSDVDSSQPSSAKSLVYPPLHPTSVPISTPVVVASSSGRAQTPSGTSLGRSSLLEDTPATVASSAPVTRTIATATSAAGGTAVPASIFADFSRSHQCFALMPDNSKMVIFDSHLLVKKAFFALVQNGVRSAPVWDSASQTFTGMLTITDFINILRHYYRSPLVQMHELEEHRIQTWRDLAIRRCHEALVSIDPRQSLYEAVQMLIEKKIHRLPVIDRHTRNCLFILTPKRLLQYIYLEFETAPDPAFMMQSLQSLGIGTFNNIATVSQDTALIVVLNIFAERRISAVPVVDHNGQVVEVYAKFDVINLAAEKTYNNLDISVKDALKHRAEDSRGVHTCLPTESVRTVLRRLVEKQVHRLVVVDTENHVAGIVSLSDILTFLILKAPSFFS